MKAIILFGLIMGAIAAPKNTDAEYRAQLMMEFKDFIVAMPMQKMYATLMDHLNNDLEMQAALKYVQGKEFKQSLRALMSRPSTKELRMKYSEAGLDLDRYEKMISDIMGGMVFSVPEDTNRSFGSYLSDLNDLIPYDKLIDLWTKKMHESPVFIKFVSAITTEEMHMLFDKTIHSPEFKRVAQDLEDMDVGIYDILKVLYELCGWVKQPAEPNDL